METRSFAACCLIQCVIILVAAAPSRSTSCQRAEYGRYCTLPSPPGRVRLIGDQLFVGAKDILLSFSFDLQSSVTVDLSPTNDTIDHCSTDPGLQNSLAACRNFIQVIEPIPLSAVTNSSQTDRILVCGTNAFFPKCRLHVRTDISDSYFMTQSAADTGFSPHSERSVVGVLATNGQFYSGTYFTPYVPHRTIGMAPRPLQGSNEFTVVTPNSDPLWLNKPDFVSVHEIDSHIYFFVREPAYEIDQGRTVVYSRAIRVCKNDQGFLRSAEDPRNNFLTFQKARMQCTRNGESGSIPYDYDNLQATYLLNSSEPILYGIFSAPANGPEGAAICKFSFAPSVTGSLTQVFEEGSYYIPSQNDQTVWQQGNPGQFACPGASGTQRTPMQARNYQLVFSPATPMDPQPIHSISGDEFTSIAVDVVEYMGVRQEILYYSLRSGEIRQFVTSGSEKREHVIHGAGEAVSNILVHKNADEIRYLYATTDNRIMSFVLGNCSQHGSCFECLDSRDPYCVWDSGVCRNKLSPTSNSQLQSFLVLERNITTTCGERPSTATPTPTTQPSTCQVGYATTSTPQPTNPPNTEGSDSPNQHSTSGSPGSTSTDCNPPPPSTNDPGTPSTGITAGVVPLEGSANQFSIPELVGASVGGFAIGIPCGLIVCCVFFVLFIRKRHGADIECRRTANEPGTVTQVNNQLDNTSSQKKEQMLQNHQRYIEPSVLTAHTQSQKNVNSYSVPQEDEYDDDVLTDLPTSFVTSSGPPGTSHHNRRQVPGYRVPRGRTDSTRWLRGSESDLSDSPGNSPLESPTAV